MSSNLEFGKPKSKKSINSKHLIRRNNIRFKTMNSYAFFLLLFSVHTVIGTGVRSINAGYTHTCAVSALNSLKCFGSNLHGQLGYGDEISRGDSPGDMGDALPIVDLGDASNDVNSVAAGFEHTCVLFFQGNMKCFGNNGEGRLGYGDTKTRGINPEDMGNNLLFVDFGNLTNSVIQVETAVFHTCVLFYGGIVKCFGSNLFGQLGYGGINSTGGTLDEMGDSLQHVDFGNISSPVVQIAATGLHTCVLFQDGNVVCFGYNVHGQLGTGVDIDSAGNPIETLDALVPIGFGATTNRAIQVVSGTLHTCVVFQEGNVKCFGDNSKGQLGYGDAITRDIVISDMDTIPNIDFGNLTGTSRKVVAGFGYTCVLFESKNAKCFGNNADGNLGYGDNLMRGTRPEDMGDGLHSIDFGALNGTIEQIDVGWRHTCVVFQNGESKCFGRNIDGQLGLGDILPRGIGAEDMGNNLMSIDYGSFASQSTTVETGASTVSLIVAGSFGGSLIFLFVVIIRYSREKNTISEEMATNL